MGGAWTEVGGRQGRRRFDLVRCRLGRAAGAAVQAARSLTRTNGPVVTVGGAGSRHTMDTARQPAAAAAG